MTPPKLRAIIAALAVFSALPLAAQSGGELGALLDSPALTWGQAARLVLGAAGQEDQPETEAFAALQSVTKLPRRAAPGREINLGDLSLITMRAFGLSGGLYRIFPTGHYACRELVYLDIIQGRADPAMKVPGERLFRILGRVLDYTGLDREEEG